MLYISLLYRLKGLKNAFGYADYVAILKISPSLDLNSTKIQEIINKALTWGQDEDVIFESKKNSELMHFTGRYKDKGDSPQVHTSDFIISENIGGNF